MLFEEVVEPAAGQAKNVGGLFQTVGFPKVQTKIGHGLLQSGVGGGVSGLVHFLKKREQFVKIADEAGGKTLSAIILPFQRLQKGKDTPRFFGRKGEAWGRNWGKGGKMDGKGNADLHHFNPVILSLVEKIQTVFPQSKAAVGKMMKSRTGKLYANDMVSPFQRGKTHGLGFEM